ncbi:MAG: chemotaxis protein CheW [Bacteroidales bacterium]|jgi:purine-binding chemotaxis protein CheW|nr:chemotaxis protein CheW [Bacteroidales bacterium]
MKKLAEIIDPAEKIRDLEIMKARTDALAGEILDETYTGREHQVFVFKLAEEQYGIEALYIQKVIAVQLISKVPQTPEFIKGLFNFRGRLYTLIDLARLFELQSVEQASDQFILLLNVAGLEMGLLINSFSTIRLVRDEELVQQIPVRSGKLSDYIKMMTKDKLVVLDIVKLLESKELLVDSAGS